MAVKKVYVSDITGKDIEGKHLTISINKTETRKYNYGYGRNNTYRTTVAKVFHLAESEAALLPEAIRQHLWPTPAPKEKPAKSEKKVAK